MTLSRAPLTLADADADGIPDAGWDGSVSAGGFQFGETEDHLVTPVVVPAGNPPKEPPSHFRLVVAPNPVQVPPGTFQVRILRTRAAGGFTPATGFLLRVGGCVTEGVGGGINLPAPAGFAGGIVNGVGAISNGLPGLPPVPCVPPCVARSVNFGPAFYTGVRDQRITRCRVTLKVDPDGEIVEYDYPFNIDVPVHFVEDEALDEDGDGVSDLGDLCLEEADPLRIEDLDGYLDDDGCRDPDDARDARQPLPSAFSARFLEGGVFDGTELLLWRDTNDAAAAPVVCGSRPRWAPLTEGETIAFDESENAQVLPAGTRFPLATQRVDVGGAELPVEALFGRVDLDLDHSAVEPSQGWVTVVTSALGRFSVGFRAVTLENACEAAPPAVLVE